MAARVTGKTVKFTLTEALASDSEILKAAGEVFAFFSAFSSGEHFGDAIGIGLICKAAAGAIKGTSELIKRLSGSEPSGDEDLSALERFQVVFYAACLEAYTESLSKIVGALEDKKIKKSAEDLGIKTKQEMLAALVANAVQAEDSETPFLLGVDPLSGEVPLYEALDSWMSTLLVYYGFPSYEALSHIEKVSKGARQRFKVFIASDGQAATWIRNYLLITTRENQNQIATDLASVRSALDSWLQTAPSPGSRHADAWIEYRTTLAALPDHKDSMYNENFGVRSVFVRPEGTYAISGTRGWSTKGQPVVDLGSVLGGLISDRVTGDDLIILCGGPGSGKSTLSRILASELSADTNVYPIFLRLRRLKEGSDIPAFLETELVRTGIIDQIRDLRLLKNVVLILDGFDELVMASRSRLRQFFNSLREDHINGPLRGMRIIVSGRDTLFPGGEGLPTGCHVLTLLPFDKPRVALWARKWRNRHKGGKGATFHPEKLVSDKLGKTPALQHLVTWPLTLHLVARVHTSGRLAIETDVPKSITKAILYKNILAETATRQRDQTAGGGRLDTQQMREFLRELAWRMYEEARDSMDPAEVLPILRNFFAGKSDADLVELGEVAVVNSPEITKGEQTGFEFVHKSFAEYLAAERIAIVVERVTFQVADFDSTTPTWRMSEIEAGSAVARFSAIRPLTVEVQEMLEPMLGDFHGFTVHVEPQVEVRRAGLNRIIERFELLLDRLMRGRALNTMLEGAGRAAQHLNLFELIANFAAGLVFLGAGAARQLLEEREYRSRDFCIQPFEGAIWRLLCIFHSGGLDIDDQVASRMFEGCTVGKEKKQVSDLDVPVKPEWLHRVDGFKTHMPKLAEEMARSYSSLVLTTQLSMMLLFTLRKSKSSRAILRLYDFGAYPDRQMGAHEILSALQEAGFIGFSESLSIRRFEEFEMLQSRFRSLADHITHDGGPSKGLTSGILEILNRLRRSSRDEVSNLLLRGMIETISGFEDNLQLFPEE